MSWHKEQFKQMENLQLQRLKFELKQLRDKYVKEPNKYMRDRIDAKVKKIKKEIEKIENA